jgi:spermidine synthase
MEEPLPTAAGAVSAAPNPPFYLSVGLVAGAIIALQIAIMRVFAVGSWAHFGSLVVSLALLGFSLASVVIFIGKTFFDQHWRGAASTALVLFGPLTVAANLMAQMVPFNAIFIVSDPAQKWRLFANFVLYLLPFLAGAFFLVIVFLKSRTGFGRVYFADLAGSGIAGLVILGAMYLFAPEQIITVPLVLWALGGLMWFGARRRWVIGAAMIGFGAVAIAAYLLLPGLTGVPDIAVSQYKGVAYARNFPDATRIYRNVSPFGDLQIYSSSYMHFAPGLSDNAAFNLPDLPSKSYVGMYIDGEGPEGIMRQLPPEDANYFKYLPMHYPYVLKQNAKTFVVQFGGGISAQVALHAGSQSVTVAENNPEVLRAFRDPSLKEVTGNILADPRLLVIDYDGRLYLQHTDKRYDVVDLSLADSVGLSNPGGFAIVEKYAYTKEAMLDYMRALAPGGILSITSWNKEEPPKSILKLYATVADAAKAFDPQGAANDIFASSSYLSTATILFKRGGFTPDEVTKLNAYTRSMSWDEIYAPGYPFDTTQTATILSQYHDSIFGNSDPGADGISAIATPSATVATAAGAPDPTAPGDNAGGAPAAGAADPTADTTDATGDTAANAAPVAVPATTMGRLAWHYLLTGGWDKVASQYVFDTRPLTNDAPYFAAYEKFGDLPKTLDRLDLFQDDWGYLVLWATLGVATACAAILILLPMLFGWRAIFSKSPGKGGTILYFAGLGLGYIMVEVGLISRFTLALTNPTISASVMIAGMLVFSGLGAFLSERLFDRARLTLPVILLAVAILLIGYGVFLAPVLDWIGAYPYGLRLVGCFALIAPPAFLMGFPMATAMTWLTRLKKDHMFVWAWGINGCFSVIGAALVPIVATNFGLAAVLEIAGVAYLVAIPAFFSVLKPSMVAGAAG